MKKTYLLLLLLLILVSSCKTQQNRKYNLSQIRAERVMISEQIPNSDEISSTKIESLVLKYKTILDAEMNKIIGRSDEAMTLGRPQSLLTNLTSDIMLKFGKEHAGQCDLALMNVHGHRADMPKGDLTLGNLFEIYSFDNSLSIIKIKGTYVRQLFESYAKMGGAGISGNVELIFRHTQLRSALIDGKEIEDDKIYTIVTLDYLADGNDGMDAMLKAESVIQTGVILREHMIDYIKSETDKGRTISSKIDNRITVQ